MATVRFSNDLKERIILAANEQFAKSVKAAASSGPAMAVWGPIVYERLFGRFAADIAKVPSGYIYTADSMGINKMGDTVFGVSWELGKAGKRPPFPTTFDNFPEDFPALRASRYNQTLDIRSHHCEPEDSLFHDLYIEVKAWNERKLAANQRQKVYVDMVKQVITVYATLSPALKAWPPLWELIPEDVRDKHRQIVERVVAPRESIDTEKLTSLATIAKLTGG